MMRDKDSIDDSLFQACARTRVAELEVVRTERRTLTRTVVIPPGETLDDAVSNMDFSEASNDPEPRLAIASAIEKADYAVVVEMSVQVIVPVNAATTPKEAANKAHMKLLDRTRDRAFIDPNYRFKIEDMPARLNVNKPLGYLLMRYAGSGRQEGFEGFDRYDNEEDQFLDTDGNPLPPETPRCSVCSNPVMRKSADDNDS